MRLQLLRRKLSSAPEIQACQEIEETLKLSVLSLRQLLVELVPPRPERAGLLDALSDYLAQTGSDAGLTCSLHGPTPAGVAASPHPLAYRMAQEAVTRLRQRPGVGEVTVGVREAGGGIEVRILGNALGWVAPVAVSAVEPSRPPDAWVARMQERALIAGGWCRTDAETGSSGLAEALTFWLPAWLPPQNHHQLHLRAPAPDPGPTPGQGPGNRQDQN